MVRFYCDLVILKMLTCFSLHNIFVQSFSRFVEVGRVALVNYGENVGRLVTIIDIVDSKRVCLFANSCVEYELNFS